MGVRPSRNLTLHLAALALRLKIRRRAASRCQPRRGASEHYRFSITSIFFGLCGVATTAKSSSAPWSSPLFRRRLFLTSSRGGAGGVCLERENARYPYSLPPRRCTFSLGESRPGGALCERLVRGELSPGSSWEPTLRLESRALTCDEATEWRKSYAPELPLNRSLSGSRLPSQFLHPCDCRLLSFEPNSKIVR